jgi:processive 1,2-diacylglycerol beta-glucosyltransferase
MYESKRINWIMKTKVLILHTSVGYGIKITAQNIGQKLNLSGEFEVKLGDIQDIEKGAASYLMQKIYKLLLDRFSSVWGFLYFSSLLMFFLLPLRKFLASFKSKRTLDLLREFQPAVVISTQAAPSGVIAYLKSKKLYLGKFVINFSDYHLHRFWVFDEADLYLCSTAEQAQQLKVLGVPEEKVAVIGLPLPDKFFKSVSREGACSELGLLTSMPTVLLTSGGNARGAIKEVFLRLLRSHQSFQLAVVCGLNEELKAELEKISSPARHPVKIFGYIDNMDILMSAASVMVGKTGGPTMAEAVAKKLPMVLTDVRPGHEQANLDYLLANRMAVYGRIPAEVVFLVESILEGKKLVDLPQAYNLIIKPSGWTDVVDAIRKIKPLPSLRIQNYQKEAIVREY